MTVPRLVAIVKYWETAPPLHEAFAAAFLSIKSSDANSSSAHGPGLESADDNDKLLRAFAGAGGLVSIPVGAS